MLNKNIKIIISLVLLIAIGFGIFEIFRIEKKSINEEDSQTQKTSKLPLPSRIVYKNKYNKYKIMNSEDKYFAEVYTLLYNQSADYTENKPELEKENISFIECTYIVQNPSEGDKNYIFLLGDDKSELEKKIQFYTEDSKTYEFEKAKSNTSKKQISKIPTDIKFWEQKDGIYKKTINYNSTEYKSILQELGIDSNNNIPELNDNYNENIINVVTHQ